MKQTRWVKSAIVFKDITFKTFAKSSSEKRDPQLYVYFLQEPQCIPLSFINLVFLVEKLAKSFNIKFITFFFVFVNIIIVNTTYMVKYVNQACPKFKYLSYILRPRPLFCISKGIVTYTKL